MKSWFKNLICGASLKLKKHDRVLIIDSPPYVWVLYLQIQQTKGLKYFLENSRISLVVQWIRICLPVQGAWICSLVQEASHASEQLNHGPPLLSLSTLELTLHQQGKPLQWETQAQQRRAGPACHNYKTPVKSNKHLGQPKINIYFLNSRKLQKSKIWMCYTLFSEHLHSISIISSLEMI